MIPSEVEGRSSRRCLAEATAAIPPQAYFLVSAIFHYLGPAFAVLLFDQVSVLGVAWLRVAAATIVFLVWRRPWCLLVGGTGEPRWVLIALGMVLGAMNVCFYLAIARLPLGTVGGIEFLGPIALAVTVTGVGLLADVRFAGEPMGFAFAFANCALFVLYVVLGHRIAQGGGSGVERLGAAMLVAMVAVTPVGLAGAARAFTRPALLIAGIGVGICSSVIPYVCDQLAMARLPRATFALLLALLPASAAVIGLVVLRQQPRPLEIAGIVSIVGGVAMHEEPDERMAAGEDIVVA
jgi:inner membrane transporter RhtA